MKLFVLLAIFVIGSSAFKRIHKQPESRIHNGQLATDEDMPYQVALFILNPNGAAMKCGGSLISERLVLSAAHCFPGNNSGTAYVGSNKYREGIPITFSRVDKHKDFDPYTYSNDIALIHLHKPVKENGKTIKYIKLDTKPLEEDKVVVSGFGKINDTEKTEDLYYTSISVTTNEYCLSFYGEPFLDSMMCCIGEHFESTCSGDSGGPVVRNWPENPVQVGIVSFGIVKCTTGVPVVYTRTADFVDWIEEHSL